jgi:hypothetical protein
MLARDKIDAKKARERERKCANAKRYRSRQAKPGKPQEWVLRNTVEVGITIDWLIAEGYLVDRVMHTRDMLEAAVTRFLDDASHRRIEIFRHR